MKKNSYDCSGRDKTTLDKTRYLGMIEKKKPLNQLGVEEVCLKPKKAIFDKLAASIRRNSES